MNNPTKERQQGHVFPMQRKLKKKKKKKGKQGRE
jgi:hypothetical protein